MAQLSSLTVSDLESELRRRQKALPRLERQRRKLLEKLAGVERDIARLGGAGGGGRGATRPRNKMPLADVIFKVLDKKTPMKVSNIVEAVKNAGYRTTSNNFSTIVNQTLIKDKRFKSAERGHYLLA